MDIIDVPRSELCQRIEAHLINVTVCLASPTGLRRRRYLTPSDNVSSLLIYLSLLLPR